MDTKSEIGDDIRKTATPDQAPNGYISRDEISKIPTSNQPTAGLSSLPTSNITHRDFAIPNIPPHHSHLLPPPAIKLGRHGNIMFSGHEVLGRALNDTPIHSNPSTAPSTAASSPRLMPIRQNSGDSTPRVRPPATTLNIPGMTTSKVSPDGKIAQRDVGAKLVVIMVGLPARGKSYITKKLHRYLSWQQHETRIFNVGNRRRVAAGASAGLVEELVRSPPTSPRKSIRVVRAGPISGVIDAPTQAAHIMLTGVDPTINGDTVDEEHDSNQAIALPQPGTIDQDASFFDPNNREASAIREQVAMSTLNELLEFLLNQGGSVGILDATNSTINRRKALFKHIKEREPKLGILFIESVCEDERLLETNMRLKLRGPDYAGKDPEKSYEDFKQRVKAYESAYVPVGKYEEDNNMQYIKMIDVGRKVIHFQLQGFLSSGIASYLATFNLSPRQIWITRHGASLDNVMGKIGGDSDLVPEGVAYGTVLYNFITKKRKEWEVEQQEKAVQGTALPPKPGDHTPPYPDLMGDLVDKNFCVWTSMLRRSIQTAIAFDEDENYDVKHWSMLNELNAGKLEGLTYDEIQQKYPNEYAKRTKDKLHYIYPGVGGEGYLQVISRLRDMVREIERIKDHVLIVGHRSICRVLMAYFMDLTRDDIADLDVPLGMLFSIEPKPYGIDFHAYRYNDENYDFDELVNYKPQKQTVVGN